MTCCRAREVRLVTREAVPNPRRETMVGVKEMRLLPRTEVDLVVIGKPGCHRSRAALRRANYEKVRSPHQQVPSLPDKHMHIDDLARAGASELSTSPSIETRAYHDITV